MERARFDLCGQWEFELDPYELGKKQAYFCRNKLNDTINVPGCWQMQNKRLPVEQQDLYTRHGVETWKAASGDFLIKSPDYFGTAWYARNLYIPEVENKQVWLIFEGIHAAGEIWLDDRFVARHQDGPWLPFKVCVTDFVKPGTNYRLTLRLSEEYTYLQGVVKSHFRGIWKSVYLEVTDQVWIQDLYAYGDPLTGLMTVEAEIDSDHALESLKYELICCPDQDKVVAASHTGYCDQTHWQTCLTIPNVRTWEPESPNLYTCTLKLYRSDHVIDEQTVRFGFRHFDTSGRQILLNGKPVFLRGCGNAGRWQPEDYAPSLDKEFYRNLISKIKSYGFNWLRYHSTPTPDECLDMADELGLMMSQELFLTLWETERERSITKRQWSMLIKKLRNHPSIWIWSMGNEMDCNHPVYDQTVNDLYLDAKQLSPGVLVTPSDGLNRTSYAEDPNDVYMVSPGVGVSVGSVFDIAPATRLDMSGTNRPLVVHELGYVESLPRPFQFDIPKNPALFPTMQQMARTAADKGILSEELDQWSRNSEKMVTKCYYMGMENLRKVDGLAGYNQWIFTDDTAERSGFVTPWLQDKTGMNAAVCNRVNGTTTISMTPLLDRYTLFDGENGRFMLHVSHHGQETLSGVLHWRLIRNDQDELDHGDVAFIVDPVRVADLGPFVACNPACGQSATLTLEAWIEQPTGQIRNEWTLWSFRRIGLSKVSMPCYQLKGVFAVVDDRPAELFPFFSDITEAEVNQLEPPAVLFAQSLLPSVVRYLKRGGRVVYCPVYYLFSQMSLPSLPSGWNNLPTWAGDNGNFGSVIYDHPILQGFPHEGWADYNFYDLLSGARVRASAPFWNMTPKAYDLDAWPVHIKPIIRSIGYTTKLTNRAHLFEARVGEGVLLGVSLRLYESLGTHPESQRLFENIISYATSNECQPEAAITADQFDKLIREQANIQL